MKRLIIGLLLIFSIPAQAQRLDYGNITEDSTFNIDIWTYAATGAPVAPSSAFVNTDVRIYKGSSATEKTSVNGITMTSPFDSLTGFHLLTVDTSNDTSDAGFWTSGSNYRVVLSTAKTVDGVAVGATVAYFSIQSRYERGTDSAALASVATEARLAELDAGNLPQDVDAILVDTGTTLDGVLATVAADVVNIDGAAMRGTDSAALASVATEARLAELDAGNLPQDVDAILLDTAEIGAAGAGLAAIPWNNASWDAEAQSEAADALIAFFTSSAQLVDDVWDEVLTGATHNVNNSSGKRLRQIADISVIHADTAQAGTVDSITLDTGASADDDAYQLNYITITGGAGAGQTRVCVDYDGTTKVAKLSRNWAVNPDSSSEFVVIANANSLVEHVGAAQAGAATTITLQADASSSNDSYIGSTVMIAGGTGQEQTRIITSYNGTTKVATVNTAWGTNPDSTSTYVVWPFGRSLLVGAITSGSNAVRDAVLADSTTFNGADIAAILVDTGTTLDAAIAALNDISANDVRAEFDADIADGAKAFQDMIKELYAVIVNNVAPSSAGGSSTLPFRNNADDATVLTHTINETTGARTK